MAGQEVWLVRNLQRAGLRSFSHQDRLQHARPQAGRLVGCLVAQGTELSDSELLSILWEVPSHIIPIFYKGLLGMTSVD